MRLTAPASGDFTYRKGELFAEDLAVSKIAERVGTPFYLYSSNAIRSTIREFQKHLSSIDVLICFAVKSCSNLAILKLMKSEGLGADIVSGGELYRALAAGIPGKNIVFSGVGKAESEICDAMKAGVHAFNLESVEELDLLEVCVRKFSSGRKMRLALRYNPDVDPKTHPYISTGLKEHKFGLDRDEVVELARRIHSKELSRFFELGGLSIHIGSQLTDLSPLEEAFQKGRSLTQELEKILGTKLKTIDLGGGLGVPYLPGDPEPAIAAYCALIKKYFSKGPRVILEPGRVMVANSGILVTEVLFRKSRGHKDFLIVDSGMSELMRPALYESHHEVIPLQESQARSNPGLTDIVGPLCESGDVLAKKRHLSRDLKRGDRLAFLTCGAYGFTMANHYNSRPLCAEVLVTGSKFEIIRRRETYADLIRLEKPTTKKSPRRKSK